MTDNNEHALDLKQQPPCAGEVRQFATGQALFFAPLPLPTGSQAMDLGGSFIEVNETYLDVGQSNFNKAFQAQLMIWGVMCMLIMCLIIAPFLVGSMSLFDSHKRAFLEHVNWILPTAITLALCGGSFAAILGGTVVIRTTLQKAQTRPIRFNRQRREVCFFLERSDEPIICPWEKVAAWVSTSTGTTGEAIMSTYTFGIAFPEAATGLTHVFNQGVMTPIHGLSKWEAIRVYMEKGPEFCPGTAPYEGLHTFDEKRQSVHENYRDGYTSAISVPWWYLCNIVTWWRFPYWVAEWDHRYSMKAMPDSITAWSQPLPAEQWAKPSAELLVQSAAIEKAFANGQSFQDYFNQANKQPHQTHNEHADSP
ncbi:DUF6708 domain-containing protein [Atopomonas sediminilitoris]|uniref:DUF6708 domain-containing protein n=1 Tax=Atopomonas sediminilitoris TaxID=2919919 RepID=UPI001F4DF650|nr:DUF6708 domain-containing protein [Atopomonas sediminilitoris]MCJ8170469.1 hypothetical protein [Atopomonas sediminilitoris]